MNSKSLIVIVTMGALGALAFAVIAMFGVQKLSENPMVRARVEVAERHKVREVSFAVDAPKGQDRTLRVGYETELLAPSMDAQTSEMEAIAQFSLDRFRYAESMEDQKLKEKAEAKREKFQPPARGAVSKVVVRRMWRREGGCFRRSEESTHEWTPPPQPSGRK